MAKMSKVTVSIPDELLERIDREARRRGISRSGFLVEAARRELGWASPAQIDAAIERGRAALAEAGSFESADLIRDERATSLGAESTYTTKRRHLLRSPATSIRGQRAGELFLPHPIVKVALEHQLPQARGRQVSCREGCLDSLAHMQRRQLRTWDWWAAV
jgi:predicted transcriptional regulator